MCTRIFILGAPQIDWFRIKPSTINGFKDKESEFQHPAINLHVHILTTTQSDASFFTTLAATIAGKTSKVSGRSNLIKVEFRHPLRESDRL